jgi:hypothetical protein
MCMIRMVLKIKICYIDIEYISGFQSVLRGSYEIHVCLSVTTILKLIYFLIKYTILLKVMVEIL